MTRLDDFISVKPTSALEEYIDSYYFHSCDNPKSDLVYTYYPHVKHAITIYTGSTVRTVRNETFVKPQTSKFTVLYSTVREQPHRVEIKGAFKKVGIVFKSHGINRFIQRPLKEFHHQTISSFEEWSPAFQHVTAQIWQTQDINERIALIEAFLNSQKVNNFNEHFHEMITDIVKSENVESVQSLSQQYGLNRKTLYRTFSRELNCNPSKFLKILRFRKSLEKYLQTDHINLTEAAAAQFYDQSDFIKNVRQITALTPKKLTKEISDLKHSIFWKIE